MSYKALQKNLEIFGLILDRHLDFNKSQIEGEKEIREIIWWMILKKLLKISATL